MTRKPITYCDIDTCVWVDPDGDTTLCNNLYADEAVETIKSFSIDDGWSDGDIYLLNNGDYAYVYTWSDYTFDGGHAYRAASLETIIKWALTDEEREYMGYEL